MNDREYQDKLSAHLLVTEPTRTDIVDEVRSHLTEHDGPNDLGDPHQLATRFNIAHLGRFGGTSLIYLIPPLMSAGYIALRESAIAFSMSHGIGSVGSLATTLFFQSIILSPYVIGSAYLGQVLSRRTKVLGVVAGLVVLQLVSIYTIPTFGYRPEFGDEDSLLILMNMVPSLFGTILTGLIVWISCAFWKRSSKKLETVPA